MDGILNIDKPAGWTSHDVVKWVRGTLQCKRVGHAGTLDPLATGVLLVCLGQATRVAEYLMAGTKTYRGEALLGIETDSYDTDGKIVATAQVPHFSEEDLQSALARFVGETVQHPPAFSAVKRDGIPLYRRARRGEQVHAPARQVRIHAIRLIAWQRPRLAFEVVCNPGTYVRSLVHDLGQDLRCGAALSALIRTRSGSFAVEDALTVSVLAEAAKAGTAAQLLLPLETALAGWARVFVDAEQVGHLLHGQAIPCQSPPPTQMGYAVHKDLEVLAILNYDQAKGSWRPVKVFARQD